MMNLIMLFIGATAIMNSRIQGVQTDIVQNPISEERGIFVSLSPFHDGVPFMTKADYTPFGCLYYDYRYHSHHCCHNEW